MSTSSHFAYLIEKIRNSWSLLRMTLAKDSAVYYPERYYYSLRNLDAFALALGACCVKFGSRIRID